MGISSIFDKRQYPVCPDSHAISIRDIMDSICSAITTPTPHPDLQADKMLVHCSKSVHHRIKTLKTTSFGFSAMTTKPEPVLLVLCKLLFPKHKEKKKGNKKGKESNKDMIGHTHFSASIATAPPPPPWCPPPLPGALPPHFWPHYMHKVAETDLTDIVQNKLCANPSL